MGSALRFLPSAAALLGFACVGCSEGAELRLRAVLPAADPSGERPWLDGVGCFVVEDRRPGEAEPVRVVRDEDPDDASLGIVSPGEHVFRVRGLDRACDANAPNPVVAEGETAIVHVRAGESVEVPYLFAPVEAFSRLEAPEWVRDWLALRRGVAIASSVDASGRTAVVFSGGLVIGVDDSAPSRETVLFFPARMEFEEGPDMACGRAYHVSVPALSRSAPEEDLSPVIALVGGEGDCASGEPSAETMEGFDPDSLQIVPVSFPTNAPLVPMVRPSAAAHGDGGILAAGGTALGGTAIQRYLPGAGWDPIAEGANVPLLGAAIATKDAPDQDSRVLVAGGLGADSDPALGPVLLGATLQVCTQADSFVGRDPIAFFLDAGGGASSPEVLVGGGSDGDGEATAQFLLYGHETPCRLRGMPVEGEMETARADASVVRLADGRVLVVGGDAEMTAEIWAPEARGFVPLGELPTDREGPETVLLPDGVVLVAGGASAEIDVFNPAREPVLATGEIGWDPDAVRELELDVLVVVSTAPTATGEAVLMQTLLGNGNGGDPAGLLAAIAQLLPDRGDVEKIVIDAHVGVVSGDLGCGPGDVGDDGRLLGEKLDGSPTYLTDEQNTDAFASRVQAGEGDCQVDQPLAAAIRALRSSENPDHFSRLREGVPLFVVLATPGDDCSQPDGAEATDCAGPLASTADLVTELLAEKGDPWLTTVIVIAGDPAVPTEHEFVGTLQAAPRLFEIVEAVNAAGGLAFHASLTGDYLGRSLQSREIKPFGDALLNRLGRSTCLPALSSGDDVRCVLTWDDIREDGTTIVRVPYAPGLGDEGWQLVPASSDRCAPSSDTDFSPRFELVLTDGYQYTVGPRVRHACE